MNCIAKLVFASLVGAGLFAGMNVQAAQKPAAASKPGKAAIASSHQLATDAGLEILAKGGNAFDAAIAVGAALAVVEPESSGLGGGGFFLLHRVKDGKDIFIDAREAAPAASRSELWADADGKLDSDKATNGPLSAGIPGEPAAYVWLAEHYGKLPLKASLAPAIRIAREGFSVYSRLHRSIDRRSAVLSRWPASAQLYLVDGKAPEAGSTWRNPDIANTLERIARHGNDGFYRGEFASKLVDSVRASGGIWTLEDLDSYVVKERAPITLNYRGWKILTAPPPSSGGIVLGEMLNMLAGYDLAKLDQVDAQHQGLVTERDDLVEAIKRLRQGIQSLNREARERLLASFAVVGRKYPGASNTIRAADRESKKISC